MADMTNETAGNRLRRLHMRSWRRGMKEMDLILGHFADDCLATLTPDDLAQYERLLSENDQDLYLWVTARIGDSPAPGDRAAPDPVFAPILDRIAGHAATRFRTA
ncbi:MAG: succinate dehydrogenase assembly factor 2 [Paracoccus sp. (in: a-proteobacteria)]|uniref:FAD assembly factor SdhE n=1 Tax=Paracoccus sp. TaxID=267 RepID=UPI003919812F